MNSKTLENFSKDDNPINKELIEELENIQIEMDAFMFFIIQKKINVMNLVLC